MKDTRPDPSADEKFAAIARELRFIRILLYGLVLLIATSVSSSLHRDVPLLVLAAGLLIPIVWMVVDSLVKRSHRARREAEALRQLSGRTARSSG